MMEPRQSTAYTSALNGLLAAGYPRTEHNEPYADNYVENLDSYEQDRYAQPSPTTSHASIEENDNSNQSTTFGVDLSGKATNLGGKSFTIAAILGLSNSEEDVINLSVQERLQQNQRQLHSYLYAGNEMQRLNNNSFCRSVGLNTTGMRQTDSPRPDIRTQIGHLKPNRLHSITCSNTSGRNKRIRTIFTPEQLERLEAEFERQQYMVGPERLYLAHALQLTEAQVKVWFQNRRIKWRKHHLESTQQRLAVLQRSRPEDEV